MSMESYELGDINNDLFLKMNVGTQGAAYSNVAYFQNGMSKPIIAESDFYSGNIKEFNFGKVIDNKNKMLHFSADINLSHLSPKEQELAKKSLSIIIEIKGGLNGTKLFHFTPDELVFSEEGETISFNKIITLV